jgi:hypothetical protein
VSYIYDEEAERYPYAPLQDPLDIPSGGIFDTPCRVICLSEAWLPPVLGVLGILLEPDSWSGTEEQRYAATQEVEKLMSLCGCEDFVSGIKIDVNTGKIQVRFGPAGDYINIEGNTTNITSNIVSPQPDMSEKDNPRCTLSTFVRNELEDMIADDLDLIDAATDFADAVTELLGKLFQWGAVVEYISDGLTAVLDGGTAWLRSQFDTEFWDGIQCALHCLLDEETPQWSDAIFDQWREDVNDLGAAQLIVSSMMYYHPRAEFQYLFWRAQFADNEPDCGFCSECEEEPSGLHDLIGDWGMVLTYIESNPYGWGEDFERWGYSIVTRNEPWNQLVGRFYASDGAKFKMIKGENQNHGWEIGYQGLWGCPAKPWDDTGHTYFTGWNDGNWAGFGFNWRWIRCITDEYTPNPSTGEIIIQWET